MREVGRLSDDQLPGPAVTVERDEATPSPWIAAFLLRAQYDRKYVTIDELVKETRYSLDGFGSLSSGRRGPLLGMGDPIPNSSELV
jgi:hypothetical protein